MGQHVGLISRRADFIRVKLKHVQWGPALAALDSDGDGFTNGEELQDPNGTWEVGSAAPGAPTSSRCREMLRAIRVQLR